MFKGSHSYFVVCLSNGRHCLHFCCCYFLFCYFFVRSRMIGVSFEASCPLVRLHLCRRRGGGCWLWLLFLFDCLNARCSLRGVLSPGCLHFCVRKGGLLVLLLLFCCLFSNAGVRFEAPCPLVRPHLCWRRGGGLLAFFCCS